MADHCARCGRGLGTLSQGGLPGTSTAPKCIDCITHDRAKMILDNADLTERPMLIKVLREGEEIGVGPATVKVIEVRGHQVRLGIEAPREVRVTRAEVGTEQKGPPRRS